MVDEQNTRIDVSDPSQISKSEADRLLGGVAGEFFDRISRGEQPEIEDYAQRYPQIGDVIREIIPAVSHIDDSLQTKSPQQLGDFRIIRQIGRGGMGIVYEAEQISMGRVVALKVLPFASMIDPKPLERFRNEVRAAASLEHPHIVSVYSVGEERGVHFYAMQLIRGQSVADVIKQLRAQRNDDVALSGSSISEILAGSDAGRGDVSTWDDTATDNFRESGSQPSLVSRQETSATGIHETHKSSTDRNYYCNTARLGIQAAEALAHAHENGVVHRDIKPGNLMLDAQGELFVTDFGLARIEAAGVTMTGDWLGTPRYMSPEQALGKPVVIDHRADIYSLGVTLYELMTLRPAFDAKDRQALLRQIANDEPKRPRAIDPRIPRELETIVLKAISKNRDERYATAEDVVDDLRSFLEDRPIKAKPPTLIQRSAKWALRHKPLVASAVVILVLASLGLAISNFLISLERDTAAWQAVRATRAEQTARAAADEAESARAAEAEQRTLAEQKAAEADAVVDFLVNDLLAATEPKRAKGREVTVKEVLDRAEDKIDSAFKDQPLVEASVRNAMGSAYHAIGQYDKAAAHIQRCREIRTKLLGSEHYDSLETMLMSARILHSQGEYEDVVSLARETQAIAHRVLGPDHNLTLRVTNVLASGLHRLGRDDEAEQIRRHLLERARHIYGPEHPFTVMAMHNVALMMDNAQGMTDEVRKLRREILAAFLRINGPDHPSTLSAMHNLANSIDPIDPDEAHKLREEVLERSRRVCGPEHPQTLMALNNLASGHPNPGESRRLAEEGFESCRRILGTGHPGTLEMMGTLCDALSRTGNLEEARDLLEEVFKLSATSEGTEHIQTLEAKAELANVLAEMGELHQARELYEQTLELSRRHLGLEHPNTVGTMGGLFMCSQVGYLPRAKAYYDEVLEMDLDKYGKQYISALHKYRGEISWYLEDYENALADFEKAIQVNPNDAKAHSFLCWALAICPEMERRDVQRAIEMGEASVKLRPTNFEAQVYLGAAHYVAGDYGAAVPALNKGLELRPSKHDPWAGFYLAMVHWRLDHKQEAVEWYEKATDWMSAQGPIYQAELGRLRDQAAELLGMDIDIKDEDREAVEEESSNDEEQSTELETDQ